MNVTIDSAGRVVIPLQVRSRCGFTPGTELALEVEDSSVRLTRVAPRPAIVERGRRRVVVPARGAGEGPAPDIVAMIERERDRWPL